MRTRAPRRQAPVGIPAALWRRVAAAPHRLLMLDYDGTLAHNGRVTKNALDAIDCLRATGRRLVLVTGRILSDLQDTFPEWTKPELHRPQP